MQFYICTSNILKIITTSYFAYSESHMPLKSLQMGRGGREMGTIRSVSNTMIQSCWHCRKPVPKSNAGKRVNISAVPQ